MCFVKNIKSGIYKLSLSLKRYPYALSFSTLTTILVILLIIKGNSIKPERIITLVRLAMITALGFPLFLCIQSFFERRTNIKNSNKIIIHITALFILIIYYFILLKEINMVPTTRYIAVNLTLYLLFLVIPFFPKKNNFELYVVKIFSRLATTLIYSFVLFVGLVITLFTLNRLLNIPVTENFYISTWFIVIGIFAPIFLLAGIPQQNVSIDKREYPRIFEILLLYIVMPLITIYSSILYLYFAKILITRQWPEGLVAHLVLWYAALCIIVLFSISPLIKKNNWVKAFSFWLPRGIIPLLLMMFVAIGIRISTYSVTENRYYVVLLGLWAMGIMLYYIFSRKKNNIILPLSLAIVAFLAVFGPWSSYSISIYSQNKRFEEIIQRYDMIKGNTIVKTEEEITEEDQREIYEILRYFKNSHQLTDIKYLPDNFKASDIEELFSFPYQSNKNEYTQLDFFSYNLNKKNQPISIRGYDYFFYITNYYNEFSVPESNLTVKFNNLNKEIKINQNNIEIYNKSLIPILVEIHRKNKSIPFEELNQKEYIYIDKTNDLRLKIIFKSFYGNENKSNPDNINIQSLEFYLLIKLT